MTSSQYILPELGLSGTNPQSTKTAETATDTKVMKQPLRRPKSNTRRKLNLLPLERTIGKPSARKVEKYEWRTSAGGTYAPRFLSGCMRPQ